MRGVERTAGLLRPKEIWLDYPSTDETLKSSALMDRMDTGSSGTFYVSDA